MDTERINDGAPRDVLAGTAYRTIARIGAGGTGVVLEAEHTKLRKRVCVKLLHEATASAEMADRMQLEAQSLAALDRHPNIVLATDFGETPEGRPFLVMERLYGRTLLAERDARGTLPPLEALDLVGQVLAGLEAVHALGVVHRDIKPGNLFVCDAAAGERRVVKLLDFGAAKLLAREDGARGAVEPRALETAQGTAIGSPRYMAPEQIIGAASIDHRVDLYSTGAVLFSLLAGRGPFDDRKEQVAIVLGQLHGTPAAPSTLAPYFVPEALDRAVLRALAKKPEDRFPDARSFAAELRRIAREIGAAARTTERLGGRPDSDAALDTVKTTDDGATMVSAVYRGESAAVRRRRQVWWVSIAGVAAGVLLGLVLLGVWR